ncbi:hypothetical protein [Synechococcus sp. CS-1326]|uniref:hypothetical protein n=1 Tax=Synechococcus sp. CS-1326 TaxID=2847978 RepID=UPI00223A6B06|nr:hypothetical protein [Synechococcus sp. CS-1326]
MHHPAPIGPTGVDALPEPGDLRIEPLQGWCLPLLQSEAFVDLQPLLQRSLLLQQPERLLNRWISRPPLAPEILVAFRRPQRIIGLAIVRRLNRSGTCWGIDQLRTCRQALVQPGSPTVRQVETALVKEALHRRLGATSWIASAATDRCDRLALLREQGFQPLRNQTVWRWEPAGRPHPGKEVAGELELCPLNRRTAALLWHLEQAACPAQLRQLLDRRSEDLLDQTQGPGLLWVDPTRQQAVAGVRGLRAHGQGQRELELTIHPGWSHLLGPPLERLLVEAARQAPRVWLRSDTADCERSLWLEGIGAVAEGEELLMGRSVWRRQESLAPAESSRWRLDTVLETFKPRRRPVPTPLLPNPGLRHGPTVLGSSR